MISRILVWASLSLYSTGWAIEKTNDDVRIEMLSRPGLWFEFFKNISFNEKDTELIIYMDLTPHTYNLTYLRNEFIQIANKCPFEGKELNDTHTEMDNFIDRIDGIYDRFDAIKELRKKISTATENGTQILEKNDEKIIIESDATRMGWKFSLNFGIIYQSRKKMEEYEKNYADSKGPYYHERDMTRFYASLLLRMIERRAETIMNISQLLRQNKLSSLLLRKNEFSEILEKIENKNRPYKIPVDPEATTIERLNSLVQTKYEVSEEILMIRITIPMIKETFALYTIHSLPIPQFIYLDNPSSAYINVENNYIIINNKSFYNIKKTELEKCLLNKLGYVCPKQWFLFKDEANCELSLFYNDKNMDYKNCDIKYKTEHYPGFIKTNACGNWLYTVAHPINLTLYCANATNREIEIRGVGMLNLKNNCRLRYKDDYLRVDNPSGCPEYKLKIPKKSLNIKHLTQAFDKQETRQLFKNLAQKGHIYSFWNLIRKCDEVTRNETNHKRLMYIVIMLSVTTALILSVTAGICTLLYVFKGYLEETPNEIELQWIPPPNVASTSQQSINAILKIN